LIKAGVVEVDGLRPRMIIPYVVGIHIKPSWKYSFLNPDVSPLRMDA
jgi:hypothetical protein